jgi:hypothetical protein
VEKLSCKNVRYPQSLSAIKIRQSVENEYNLRPQNLNKKRIDMHYKSRRFDKLGGFQDNNNYWSSTPNADNSGNAWNANNNNGNVNSNNDNMTNQNLVRCVH